MSIGCGSFDYNKVLGLLIKDLVKCLDDACDLSAEYQAVIRELWTLDRILLQVKLFFQSCEHTSKSDAIRATVC